MKQKLHLSAVFCTIVLWGMAFAQRAASQTAGTPASKAVDLFYQAINENAHLYNGTEYIMYDQHIKGDPYFIKEALNGSVYYDGTLYNDVSMLYQITDGSLVVRQYNAGVLITLVKEKIGYFNLYGHTFIHIVPDSGTTVMSDGFYDRLYNAGTGVYVKREKLLYEDPTTYERTFLPRDKYFIYRNNIWYPVAGEADALKVFKDRKKDVSKFLRQNKIKFKKTPELAMVKMAEYYDTLTH